MAANSLPQDPQPSSGGTWQTLVSDRRYRLFAAGERRAAIAECLPPHISAGDAAAHDAGRTAEPRVERFDARYGLIPQVAGARDRMVLLTQVERSLAPTPFRIPAAADIRRNTQWKWEASHSVKPISQLQSYIDEQSGTLVFFLTRANGARNGGPTPKRERLEDSALRIGRSLGLDDDNLEALRVASLVHEISKGESRIGALGSLVSLGDAESEEAAPCKVADCHMAGAIALGGEHFCRQHFVAECYERLDGLREQLNRRRPSEKSSEEIRTFLRECTGHAAELTRNPFSQDALERARLLDILHTATDLGRQMRRSARREKAFEVRVLCETPGRPWAEEMRTVQVSRHGAMFECSHLVRPEDWLFVERAEAGSRARARMAWRGPAKGGRFMLGLEFVDQDNFWGLDWADA